MRAENRFKRKPKRARGYLTCMILIEPSVSDIPLVLLYKLSWCSCIYNILNNVCFFSNRVNKDGKKTTIKISECAISRNTTKTTTASIVTIPSRWRRVCMWKLQKLCGHVTDKIQWEHPYLYIQPRSCFWKLHLDNIRVITCPRTVRQMF